MVPVAANLRGRWCDTASGLTGTDFGNPAAVDAEIGGDVVLLVAASQHPFNNGDLICTQGAFVASPVRRIGNPQDGTILGSEINAFALIPLFTGLPLDRLGAGGPIGSPLAAFGWP